HRREIKDHLKNDLNGNDIWVFEGHGNDCDGDGVVDGLAAVSGLCGWGDGHAIPIAQLIGWMAGHNPGIVILSGCQTGDLLAKLKAAGVKCAVGFCGTVTTGNDVLREKAFLKKLFDGGTVQQALDEANKLTDGLNPGTKMCADGAL